MRTFKRSDLAGGLIKTRNYHVLKHLSIRTVPTFVSYLCNRENNVDVPVCPRTQFVEINFQILISIIPETIGVLNLSVLLIGSNYRAGTFLVLQLPLFGPLITFLSPQAIFLLCPVYARN